MRRGSLILPRVDAGTLRDIVAARRYDDFVSALEAMVNVDCGSYSPAGVNAIADMCEARFRARTAGRSNVVLTGRATGIRHGWATL